MYSPVTMKIFTSLIAALATANICAGFTLAPKTRAPSSSARYLVPEQGCQLKAAWEAASASHHDDINHHDGKQLSTTAHHVQAHPMTPASAARAFASRLFTLPASLLHPHSSETADVVYYPIVGFHYTLLSSKPLPTTPFPTAAACRIPPPPTSERLYGWFSQGCHLNHPDSDDYLQEPKRV
jgi:hypothetical protein